MRIKRVKTVSTLFLANPKILTLFKVAKSGIANMIVPSSAISPLISFVECVATRVTWQEIVLIDNAELIGIMGLLKPALLVTALLPALAEEMPSTVNMSNSCRNSEEHLVANHVKQSKLDLEAMTTKAMAGEIVVPNLGNVVLPVDQHHGSVEGTVVKRITIKEARLRPGHVVEMTIMVATITSQLGTVDLQVVDLLPGSDKTMLLHHHLRAINMDMAVILVDMARPISKAWVRPQVWPPAPVGLALLPALERCFKTTVRMGALVVHLLLLRLTTHLLP